jgi:hypothetical protein
MSLTILPDDFLKSGDPRRTWQPGHVPTNLNRHGRHVAQGPAEQQNSEHEALRDWLAHVEAGRIGRGYAAISSSMRFTSRANSKRS